MSNFDFIEKTHWDVWVDGNHAGVVHKTPRGFYYMPKGQTKSMMVPKYFDTFDQCKSSVEGDS